MRLAQLGLDVMMGDDLSEAGDDSDGGGAAAPLDPYTAARRLHRLRPEVPPPFSDTQSLSVFALTRSSLSVSQPFLTLSIAFSLTH